MEIKKLNWTIATLIILTNLYFIPLNFITVKESGGPMGFGLINLPLLLSTNLLLIPAVLTFNKKFKNSIILLIINGLGIVWNLFWLYLFLTTPKMD
jgi:hypothetical protein